MGAGSKSQKQGSTRKHSQQQFFVNPGTPLARAHRHHSTSSSSVLVLVVA
jgi:hypothetical protein